MADNNVTVKGTVASVVFRNDETGYTVLVLELVDEVRLPASALLPTFP